MTDWLLALVPQYGLWLLFAVTYLSCLALPLPSSLLMLTAGGFVAAGDLDLLPVMLVALGGAILGDQTGYLLGRHGGGTWLARIQHDPARARLVSRATGFIDRRGDTGIFLSRWLFSALGPYANFAAGAVGFAWLRFTLFGAAGEAVWVGLYIGLGNYFAGNLQAASDMLGSILGILASGTVMVVLGLWLLALARRRVT